jgi:hypothetical protein
METQFLFNGEVSSSTLDEISATHNYRKNGIYRVS